MANARTGGIEDAQRPEYDLSGASAAAIIDLDAIAHNVGILREHAGGASIMAIVKSDGYNHGAVEVSRAALGAGATDLGVTTIAEALPLRQAGITAPILAWLHPVDADFGIAISNDIEIGISYPSQLDRVIAAARIAGVTATVTLKIDTGLNRNGLAIEDVAATLETLGGAVREDSVRLRGIFTHLACADDPHSSVTDTQVEVLREVLAQAARAGVHPEVVHVANSAATLTRPDLAFDMVRPGIAIYGQSPVPALGDFGLIPAMTLVARVALVKSVKAGEGVSYGHLWTAPRDTVVALVPLGYADGVVRNLTGRIDVLVGGRLRRSVGRICMDQFLVDLGDNSDGISPGDDAILFGPGNWGEPRAQDWAEMLDTINYEIVTGIRGRALRMYSGGAAR